MGHIIIGDKGDNRFGTAVFFGKTQDHLYWLTCRHVLEAAAEQPLKIDGSLISVEHKFDADLALLSTATAQGNPSVTTRTLSFAMPREVYLVQTIPAKNNIHYTTTDSVPLRLVPPKSINDKTTQFLYNFKELDPRVNVDGESGSPILNWKDHNALVGILIGTDRYPVVLLFGAMSAADKNKLKDISKKYISDPVDPTPVDPLEYYRTWRKSEIDAIENELKQFSSRQTHIVVLSGPAKVGKTKFLNAFCEYINEIAAPLFPPPFSTLLLKVRHKKQENQAAIFTKSSVDAAKNAFIMLVNLTPLTVN